MPISFYSEDIIFNPAHPRKTSRWIKDVIGREGQELDTINYVFCSDAYLLQMNRDYLGHSTYTDIITFDNREGQGPLDADIFISVDRVRENAEKFGVSFDQELHRVMIHGVLHLLGYKDKTNDEKARMRKKEDAYLSLR